MSLCPSLTPYPAFNVSSVDLAATSNTTGVSITTAQDAGSALLGGSYALSFTGVAWTAQIPVNATTTQVAAALFALPEIVNVKVVRDTSPLPLTGLTLSVVVLLPVTNLPTMLINSTALTGPSVTAYVNEANTHACSYFGAAPWTVLTVPAG